jgi:hypothetical protein
VAETEQKLHSILTMLEECRKGLIDRANQDTARLVAVAILDLRMKLNRIGDSELMELCDAMLAAQPPVEASQSERRAPLLKVVK